MILQWRRVAGYGALALVVAYGGYSHWKERPVRHGPGEIAPREPRQAAVENVAPFSFRDYTITPKAAFDIEARVLGKKRYRFGRGADICPVDLAMGWGPMSDETVLKHINIDQSARWYSWDTREFPIPRRRIETSSANMHIIPADAEVRRAALSCRVGQLVHFRGYLVNVTGDDGSRQVTSLSRKDTGANSCEIVFVQSFRVVDPASP